MIGAGYVLKSIRAKVATIMEGGGHMIMMAARRHFYIAILHSLRGLLTVILVPVRYLDESVTRMRIGGIDY